MKKKILVALGTRPEAIKLVPLILAIRESSWAEPIVCTTGQHREMSARVLDLFGVKPDIDLNVMRQDQTLTDVTTSILSKIDPYLAQCVPDWVIVQGDTTTTFAVALAAYYRRIRVAHVEAGLRTGNIYSPWPEEMNRRLVSEIALEHFPPTVLARDNLLAEGVSAEHVHVTGNTGIDTLKQLIGRLETDQGLQRHADTLLAAAGVPMGAKPLVLITGHRRESFGEGFKSICTAISTLAIKFSECDFVYPVHPNPHVRETVHAMLGANKENIYLVPPLEYLPFIALMSRASLILTDSGGVQEEAPSLGKRVVVLRAVTERKEGLSSGLIRLVGTDTNSIVSAASDAISGLWTNEGRSSDVYGDGQASLRILDTLRRNQV